MTGKRTCVHFARVLQERLEPATISQRTVFSGSWRTCRLRSSPLSSTTSRDAVCSGRRCGTPVGKRQGVNLIVQVSRLQDGSRKMTHITEVLGYDTEKGEYKVQDIFVRKFLGISPDGK